MILEKLAKQKQELLPPDEMFLTVNQRLHFVKLPKPETELLQELKSLINERYFYFKTQNGYEFFSIDEENSLPLGYITKKSLYKFLLNYKFHDLMSYALKHDIVTDELLKDTAQKIFDNAEELLFKTDWGFNLADVDFENFTNFSILTITPRNIKASGFFIIDNEDFKEMEVEKWKIVRNKLYFPTLPDKKENSHGINFTKDVINNIPFTELVKQEFKSIYNLIQSRVDKGNFNDDDLEKLIKYNLIFQKLMNSIL